MSVRSNILILATVVAATFGVGMVSAEVIGSPNNSGGKADRLFTASLNCGAGACALTADAFLTLEYRGPNMSILARVPVQPAN
jgi:hypothetical protein